MNSNTLRIAILSISLLTVMAGAAISPALADIAKAFPDASETMIKLILTLPSVMIIPFTFISSYLCNKFTKKNLVLVGIIFYVIGGFCGGLVTSIETLLLFRAILGIGVGLLMPISTSIVADFYDGAMRTKVMGQVSAANNLGGIVLFISSGFLASISWRMSFSVYLVAIIVALLVFFFLPPTPKDEEASMMNKKSKLPVSVYGYGLAMFFLLLAFYSLPANIALYMQETGLGDSKFAGIVISIGTATGFFAGLLLSKLTYWLKGYFLVIQLLLMSIGFVIMGWSYHIIFLMLGIGIIGFGFGSLMPTVMDRVTKLVPRNKTVRAMAIVTSMLFLGQFLSPLVLDFIGWLVGNETIRFTYQFVGVSIFIMTLFTFCYVYKQKIKKKTLRAAS
ncbi:MFS transporter [Alkalihalobacillus trypoxylicola]|uniref:Major facilitator superfamily (MFS) profile domain-containing protein n=1 Tax=Alkalihalobacillus trypoxylicola TaxID=519424 RepID=A0A161Q1K2_9BACI|nr:MFS transporter [Alkalihalobacillus trypoxylicola]KYG34861.1 hypothetical protein AZF04_00565 [Alkalihalobacillus trypoxylicola]GAF66814.1 putative MFS transporter [Bacillus sp. TS-2]